MLIDEFRCGLEVKVNNDYLQFSDQNCDVIIHKYWHLPPTTMWL